MSALFKSRDPKVVRMPDMADPIIKQAEARKRREIASRSGRSSTLLSQGGGDAGTRSYGNSLLGSAG